MVSIRERQRLRRRAEIVQAAIELFSKQGYERTTIEEIADEAVVAPATVYNYFGSKFELLRRVVSGHIQSRRVERQPFLVNPPQGLHTAVNKFVDLLLDNSLDDLNKDLWRQVLASALSRSSDSGDLLDEVTTAIVGQFQTLYETLQERGELAADVPACELAEASMAVADFHFYRMIRESDRSIAETKEAMKRQLELVLGGSAKNRDAGGR